MSAPARVPVRRLRLALACMLIVAAGAMPGAQGPPPPNGPPASPRDAAPLDLTGTWVSIVNEDWRWRMVTAPKGDFQGIPLNEEGTRVANAWDPATDGSCQAFGAAALLRMPTRLRIAWQDEQTLTLETDNGRQTRTFRFDGAPPRGRATLQGHSVASWARNMGASNPFGINPPGGPPPAAGGALKVVTTNLSGGWLRRNGVPYSGRATVTEYFDRFPSPDGTDWFVVTTIVVDPTYLTGRFVTSTHYRREPDGSTWNPRACRN